ncbi:MAG TPA: hypothetical protein VFM93_06060 [Candidatus Limnocylindria bacterium]|nr:hypothetical protein [Candidatus Limnocylindria bacterium]
MSFDLAFVAIALALSAVAALLLVGVVIRRGRRGRDVVLAAFLIVLAFGVWWVGIREPFRPF